MWGSNPRHSVMAGDNDRQASTGEAARRTRKGKTPQRVQIDKEATDGNETKYFDNEDEGGSESDDDDNRYDYRTLAKIWRWSPSSRHGTYDRNHPKWNRTFDNTLVGVLRSTLDTEGEYNVLYLLLDISKNHLTCHQAWKKIERSLTSEAARTSRQIALLAELNETKMFHADAQVHDSTPGLQGDGRHGSPGQLRCSSNGVDYTPVCNRERTRSESGPMSSKC
ncbi:uncharacterized protein UDID_18688 [Ustilago sp. UG-2017a]|nr:uncharacterized protein UDID_18688 [Ustilago sp. UG-2017a]